MQSLREIIADARARKVAVGHFNVSNIEGVWAIVHAARALKVPVIIGLSEGERDFVGVRQAVAFVRSVREEYDQPVFINADHTYSLDRVREAVDADFDAVIFDGAQLSVEENIATTTACVRYARARSHDQLVEGELGYIGTSSKILDQIPDGAAVTTDTLTTSEEAAAFVTATGVDLFAPAVGSIHGMLRTTHDPDLAIERIASIAAAVSTPLVLHGASGLREENLRAAIAAGISVVHINTELRLAYRDAVKLSLTDDTDQIAPYKIMKPAVLAMQKLVEQKLKLFNRLT